MELALSLVSQLVLALGFTFIGMKTALYLLMPRLDGLEWPERARLTWPARLGAALALVFFPLFAAATVAALAGPLSGPPVATGVGLFIPCVALAAWLRARFDHAIRPNPGELSVAARLRGRWAFLLVMYGHLFTLIALGVSLAWLPVWSVLPVLLFSGLLVAGWAYGWGLDLAIRLGLAAPASPELNALVRGRAAVHGVDLARVDVLQYDQANAFAFPVARRVAFTRGALGVLTDPQIAGIADHELGHIAEPRSVLLIRLASAMSLVPLVALAPAVSELGPIGGLVPIGVFLVARLASARVRKRMEERADAHAHDEDAETYARALEALYRFNRAPAVIGRGPHPDLYDRMVSAGVEPDWPKPEPPSRWGPRLRVGGAVFVAFCVVLGSRIGLGVFQMVWSDVAWLQALWGGSF